MRTDTHIALENVRSAHNVGAIFRTAEAIGVSKIYLVGYTPLPIDRFGRPQPDIAKTALGAERMILWEHQSDTESVINIWRREGRRVVAVEKTDDAGDYKECAPSERMGFIFGNEVEGVQAAALASADQVIELPMNGRKESLNVATTAGIVLYRILDR